MAANYRCSPNNGEADCHHSPNNREAARLLQVTVQRKPPPPHSLCAPMLGRSFALNPRLCRKKGSAAPPSPPSPLRACEESRPKARGRNRGSQPSPLPREAATLASAGRRDQPCRRRLPRLSVRVRNVGENSHPAATASRPKTRGRYRGTSAALDPKQAAQIQPVPARRRSRSLFQKRNKGAEQRLGPRRSSEPRSLHHAEGWKNSPRHRSVTSPRGSVAPTPAVGRGEDAALDLLLCSIQKMNRRKGAVQRNNSLRSPCVQNRSVQNRRD
ncbi:hypothetical protein MUK42_37064 [Musa troglodytarum]|uniref:Uncharacterized protein n=1 Tax=Musa troglodytarum TaxID=320322 RepID=A0A9E7FX87_9LILI|nr:hypothetical protein MUK42_37064 [Musa troglodytarum]